jgi:hypothetical protein
LCRELAHDQERSESAHEDGDADGRSFSEDSVYHGCAAGIGRNEPSLATMNLRLRLS